MSKFIASHVVVLVVGMSLGLGAVAVADRQAPEASSSATSNAAVVRELKRITKAIGTSEFAPNSLRSDFREQIGSTLDASVKDKLENICRAITGSGVSC